MMERNSCYVVDGFYWDVNHDSWQGLVLMHLKNEREDEVEHVVYEGTFRKKITCVSNSKTKFYL